MSAGKSNPVKAAISGLQSSAKGKLASVKTERKSVPSRDGLAKYAKELGKTIR
jgi:hypothetical protein